MLIVMTTASKQQAGATRGAKNGEAPHQASGRKSVSGGDDSRDRAVSTYSSASKTVQWTPQGGQTMPRSVCESG